MTERTRYWMRWWVIVALLAVLLYVLLSTALLAQAPPPQPPCSVNPAAVCSMVAMTIGREPRAFTAADLNGQDPATVDEHAVCLGRVMGGTLRYFTNGGAPSATVGTLVPQPWWVAASDVPLDTDPDGTLDDGGAIFLYNRALIVGFKATAADSGGAELAWECSI